MLYLASHEKLKKFRDDWFTVMSLIDSNCSSSGIALDGTEVSLTFLRDCKCQKNLGLTIASAGNWKQHLRRILDSSIFKAIAETYSIPIYATYMDK